MSLCLAPLYVGQGAQAERSARREIGRAVTHRARGLWGAFVSWQTRRLMRRLDAFNVRLQRCPFGFGQSPAP